MSLELKDTTPASKKQRVMQGAIASDMGDGGGLPGWPAAAALDQLSVLTIKPVKFLAGPIPSPSAPQETDSSRQGQAGYTQCCCHD